MIDAACLLSGSTSVSGGSPHRQQPLLPLSLEGATSVRIQEIQKRQSPTQPKHLLHGKTRYSYHTLAHTKHPLAPLNCETTYTRIHMNPTALCVRKPIERVLATQKNYH